MSTLVAEAVKKQLHIGGTTLQQLLQDYYNRSMSTQEFCETFGSRLQLVPRVCTQHSLIQIYQGLKGALTQQVSQ
jgi:hypothetical protein